jgi:4'-phosphopantetheinyl transferase EntD
MKLKGLILARMADLPSDVLTTLSDTEQQIASAIPNDTTRRQFTAGRWAARQAIANQMPGLAMSGISVVRGNLRQPVVLGSDIQVSISHTRNWVGAYAFPARAIGGLDIEEPRSGLVDIWHRITTARERNHLGDLDLSPEQKTLLVWAAKESLAKALRTGISTTLDPFAIAAVTSENGVWSCRYVGFPMLYATVTFHDGIVLALAQDRP